MTARPVFTFGGRQVQPPAASRRRVGVLAVARHGSSRLRAAVIVEFSVVAENNDGHLTLAQDGKLHGLFQQSLLAFHERDLALPPLRDRPNVNLLSACSGDRHSVDSPDAMHGSGETRWSPYSYSFESVAVAVESVAVV